MEKKRLVFFLLIVTIIIACWAGVRFVEKGQIERRINNGDLLYNMYPVKVYLRNEFYCVAIFTNSKPVKGAEFSASRQCVFTDCLDLVNIPDIQCYLGKTLTDIESELGAFHVDMGSGGFMPSYLTEDGYLVIFTVNRSTKVVERVGRIDLFTSESTEWFLLVEDN